MLMILLSVAFGSSLLPIPATIEHLKTLKKQGANIYCWSSGGADYAKKSATEFGIADIFTAFPARSHD